MSCNGEYHERHADAVCRPFCFVQPCDDSAHYILAIEIHCEMFYFELFFLNFTKFHNTKPRPMRNKKYRMFSISSSLPILFSVSM